MSRKYAWRLIGAVVWVLCVFLVWRGIVWARVGYDLLAAVLFVTAAFLVLWLHDNDEKERKRRDY